MELGHRRPRVTIDDILYDYNCNRYCREYYREAKIVFNMLLELESTGHLKYANSKMDKIRASQHIRRQTVHDVSHVLAMNIYGTTDLWGDQQ
jgi:hypothetical protein